jgi:hypothetical protein
VSNESSEYFTSQRREIEEQGLIADEFLATNPDCPVFGINLACAYPFPATAEPSYTAMAARLADLDEGVYVYPLWETHITIVTFLSFRLHQYPSAKQMEELRSCIGPIVEVMNVLFDTERFEPFRLEFQPPVLTRKAAILPVANPSGEIARLRQRAGQLLEGHRELHKKLLHGGLNVPGIIHSTIMRLKKAPRDLSRFVAGFDAVAVDTAPFALTVREIFLTVETKPYMRGGEVVRRFPLAGAQRNV